MTELLIVGALTIDRFVDGRAAPGGSVIHAGEAAVAEGAMPTFLTVAGDEPEARDGLSRLAAMGKLIHQPAARTASYAHDESGGRRVLVYRAATDAIQPVAGLEAPGVAVFAPIADELPAAAFGVLLDSVRPRSTTMLIQGWLRRLDAGQPVGPLPLAEVPDALWSMFGRAAAVVVSNEDLSEGADDPEAQVRALRVRLGEAPLLILTLGPDGYLLDEPRPGRLVSVPPSRVVEGAQTVGAGDVFGATLAIHLGRGADATTAAGAAAARVARVLEARRP